MLKKLLLTTMVVLLLAPFAWAQMQQTGSLSGTVKDAEGVPIPGFEVVIKSPALILPQLTAVTNENGVYRFPTLAPGFYEVTFQLEGFKTIVRREIRVLVGQTAFVDVTVELGAIEEQIVVSGQAPTIDRQKTTRTANLDRTFLSSIPATRNLGTYFNMTPGVTGDTAHGSSVRDNAYNLDGVNLADATVGTPGVFFGMDIMEEISVQTGGLSAEHGSVRGAVVNVITKSGGNRFSGSASMYYRGEKFQSDNTKGTPLEGRTSGFKYEMEPGVTLGGPVIKDKLWFFMNLSFNKSESFVAGYPYDQATDVPPDDFRPFPYIKFTLQPDKDNKFVLSYNLSDIRRNHRGASMYQTVDTTWKQLTPTHVFNFHYTRLFGADFFMNFKIGMALSKFDLLAKNDQAAFYNYNTGQYWGSYGYDDMNLRDRYQFNTDGTFFIDGFGGSHEMKIGAEVQYGKTGRAMNFRNVGPHDWYYVMYYMGAPYQATHYRNLDKRENMLNFGAFWQDTWSVGSRLTLNLGIRFDHQVGIIPKQNESAVDAVLIPGYPYIYNTAVPEALTALKWTTLSPRAGFVFDLTNDSKTLLKGSYSRYTMANITQWFSGANPNGFVAYGGRVDANLNMTVLQSIGLPNPTTMGYPGYDLKAPYIDEVTIGIEREFATDWSVGARYIRKWDRNLQEQADASQLDLEKLLSGGGYDWYNWTPVNVTDPYNGQSITFWNRKTLKVADNYAINPPDAIRDYQGFEFTLNKRFSNRWSMNASYVYAKSTGLIGTDFNASWGGTALYTNPNAHTNLTGSLSLERPHQIKLQGLWQGPLGINLSAYYRFLSGLPYARSIRSLDVGLTLAQGTATILAEESGSRRMPDLSILDLRVEKVFRIGKTSFGVFADIFNALNANKATAVVTTSGHPTLVFEQMTGIQDPRMFRAGFKFEF